jgi:hypothetical protein
VREAENIAEGLDGDDCDRNGILFRNDIQEGKNIIDCELESSIFIEVAGLCSTGRCQYEP